MVKRGSSAAAASASRRTAAIAIRGRDDSAMASRGRSRPGKVALPLCCSSPRPRRTLPDERPRPVCRAPKGCPARPKPLRRTARPRTAGTASAAPRSRRAFAISAGSSLWWVRYTRCPRACSIWDAPRPMPLPFRNNATRGVTRVDQNPRGAGLFHERMETQRGRYGNWRRRHQQVCLFRRSSRSGGCGGSWARRRSCPPCGRGRGARA